MAEEKAPKTLDWVKCRSKCSVEHLFKLLMEVVDSDVQSIHHHTIGRGANYEMETATPRKYVVSRVTYSQSGTPVSASVVFEATPTSIVVRRGLNETPLFTAKPSFHFDESCCLEVDRRQMELWEVSRLALEDLFFCLVLDRFVERRAVSYELPFVVTVRTTNVYLNQVIA